MERHYKKPIWILFPPSPNPASLLEVEMKGQGADTPVVHFLQSQKADHYFLPSRNLNLLNLQSEITKQVLAFNYGKVFGIPSTLPFFLPLGIPFNCPLPLESAGFLLETHSFLLRVRLPPPIVSIRKSILIFSLPQHPLLLPT